MILKKTDLLQLKIQIYLYYHVIVSVLLAILQGCQLIWILVVFYND